MPLQDTFQRIQRLFRLALPKKIDAVIDSWVLISQRTAVQPHGVLKCRTGLGRFAKSLQRQGNEPVDLRVSLIVRQRPSEHSQRGLESIEQIQSPPVVKAGIRKRGLEFAGRTERLFRQI